jgi:hypothetical protein
MAVVPVIAGIVVGFSALGVLAIFVGVLDAAQAPRWRRVARDRRQLWESRQL